MSNEQHVCTVCGYNMIGERPDRCPFREAGARLWRLIENRGLTRVCGWNYVADYAEWREQFRALLETAGTV
jgi:rubredoxin